MTKNFLIVQDLSLESIQIENENPLKPRIYPPGQSKYQIENQNRLTAHDTDDWFIPAPCGRR